MGFIITLIVLIYVFSPHDLMRGPLDDLLVIMLGSALKKHFRRSRERDHFRY